MVDDQLLKDVYKLIINFISGMDDYWHLKKSTLKFK